MSMNRGWQGLLVWIGSFWWLLAHAQAPLPTEVLPWQHRPLTVVLPIGQEQILRFDEPVTFNSPESDTALTRDHLQVTNVDRHVYLRALQAFDTQRVLVTLQSTGQVVLLDIRAQEEASDRAFIHIQTSVTSTVQPKTCHSTSGRWVRLIRHALHRLYAPARLIPDDFDVVRQALGRVRGLPFLAPEQPIEVKALAQWRSLTESLYVTAIEVRHQGSESSILDPRTFCGDWLAASVFPRRVLGERGSETDTTTVFLVSRYPFTQSLERCHGT